MNKILHYKGFKAKVIFDDDAQIFHGEVLGLKDVITFQCKTVSELDQAFKDSIDDYLAWRKAEFRKSGAWEGKVSIKKDFDNLPTWFIKSLTSE